MGYVSSVEGNAEEDAVVHDFRWSIKMTEEFSVEVEQLVLNSSQLSWFQSSYRTVLPT